METIYEKSRVNVNVERGFIALLHFTRDLSYYARKFTPVNITRQWKSGTLKQLFRYSLNFCIFTLIIVTCCLHIDIDIYNTTDIICKPVKVSAPKTPVCFGYKDKTDWKHWCQGAQFLYVELICFVFLELDFVFILGLHTWRSPCYLLYGTIYRFRALKW